MEEKKYVDRNEGWKPDGKKLLELSVSAVQSGYESPRDYWWRYVLGNKSEQTPAMKDGEIVHMLLLEPERFYESYFTDQDIPEDKKILKTVDDLKLYMTEAGEKPLSKWKKEELLANVRALVATRGDDRILIYDDWMETQTRGREYISRAKWERFHLMRDQVIQHKFVSTYLPLGKKEVSLEAEILGIKARCRVDWLADDPSLPYVVVIDYKKTMSAKERVFLRNMEDQGGHIQLAMYTLIVEKLYPGRPCLFAWVAAEDGEPYHCEVYSPAEVFLEAGIKDAEYAIKRIKSGYASGIWPGYSDGNVQPVFPSKFLLDRIAYREQEEENQAMEDQIEAADGDEYDDSQN